MAKSIDQFAEGVDKRLQDAGAKLKADARNECVAQAIRQRYSKDRPQEKVTDVAGNATALLDLPAGWEDGFSRPLVLEHPVGNVPPTLLADEAWQMYRSPTGLKIMLLDTKPAATENVRVTWTARHNEDGSTVPEPDFDAVCDYAASLGFDGLAALYTQSSDPTILADAVNYRTKGQEYLSLAAKLRKRYFEALGIEPEAAEGSGPAISLGEFDADIGGTGIDRLTHSRVTR